MSETPSETGINKHGRQQVGSAEANSRAPGSRSLQAGGEFLKALASDLAAVASRLTLSLTMSRRRPRPSAPSRTSQGLTIGRILWPFSIALFGFLSICAVALSAVTLWLLFGFPPEPRRSDAETLGSQFEARKSGSLGGVGPLTATGASRQDLGHKPEPQPRPEAKVTRPSIVFSGTSPPAQSDDSGGARTDRSFRASNCTDQPIDGPRRLCETGSSSAEAAELKPAKETPIEVGAGADQPQLTRVEPQDRRPAAGQQESSRTLTQSRPRMQCNLDLCAATYASFHAADCTYQPHGGGPRRICELSARSADARPQTLAATDRRSEAKDMPDAERATEVPKSTTPARTGAQCNVDRCAATYASFHAADCTYQPYEGGPRRICER